jgi:cation transport regulator
VPYTSNGELPVSVRRHLPEPAQSIYREAFNHAWDSYALDPRREEVAYRFAWSAVKNVTGTRLLMALGSGTAPPRTGIDLDQDRAPSIRYGVCDPGGET